MKRLLSTMFVAMMFAGLVSCGKKDSAEPAADTAPATTEEAASSATEMEDSAAGMASDTLASDSEDSDSI